MDKFYYSKRYNDLQRQYETYVPYPYREFSRELIIELFVGERSQLEVRIENLENELTKISSRG